MTPEFDQYALQRLTDVFNTVAAPPTPMLSDALSPSTLARAAEDLYALATSPDAEDNLRQLLSNFNEQKITAIIDNIKAELMAPQTAGAIARYLKETLNRTSNEEFLSQMKEVMQAQDPMQRMMLNMMMMQTLPALDMMRAMPEAQIAGQVVAAASQLPTRPIVQKLVELGGNGGGNPPKHGRKFDL